MHEIDEQVRSFYGEPPVDPDARERALARLREEIRRTSSAPAPPPERRRRPRRKLAVALAAMAALVIATALLVLPQRSSPAAALDRLAQVAGQIAPPDAGSFPAGQMEVLRQSVETHISPDNTYDTYTLFIRSSITTDVLSDGGEKRTETIRDVSFASNADRATWVEVGRPDLPKIGDVQRQMLTPKQAAWFDAAAVSADTNELLTALANDSIVERRPGTDQEFLLIGELLAQPGLTADQRASLYRAAASLDGVEQLGPTSDPVGRGGEGFAVTAGNDRAVLIFDPITAAPLATEEYIDGQLVQWYAFSTGRSPST
jgi:hypothetical protein